ncbi:MAG: HEAT repeat domain-containing protein [Candidatus Latescibacterota bacterium]
MAAGLLLACGLAGCGPSLDEQVERLGGSAEEREQARQELLLAKDQAVEPLLKALTDPRRTAARAELAGVLVSLMTRVEDPRIPAALLERMVQDPDPRVRARIAYALGLHQLPQAADGLLAGLEDPDAQVRLHSFAGLCALQGKLPAAQGEALRQRAPALMEDPDPQVRQEALIYTESVVREMLTQAQQAALKAELAQAESLLSRSLAYAPASSQAQYRLARFLFDGGRREEGLALLRQRGMLLDVPLLTAPPTIDGRLDDPFWGRAARADSFWAFSSEHPAALPAQARSRLYVARTPAALCLGLQAWDEHPDSLVVKTRERDGSVWFEDMVEIYVDASLDHRSYVHLGANSIGVLADAWHPDGLQSGEPDWNAEATFATHVGADHWSLEGAIRLGQAHLPRPRPGEIWGFNVVRVFRGSEFTQWKRTYGWSAHTPDDFGLLVFH